MAVRWHADPHGCISGGQQQPIITRRSTMPPTIVRSGVFHGVSTTSRGGYSRPINRGPGPRRPTEADQQQPAAVADAHATAAAARSMPRREVHARLDVDRSDPRALFYCAAAASASTKPALMTYGFAARSSADGSRAAAWQLDGIVRRRCGAMNDLGDLYHRSSSITIAIRGTSSASSPRIGGRGNNRCAATASSSTCRSTAKRSKTSAFRLPRLRCAISKASASLMTDASRASREGRGDNVRSVPRHAFGGANAPASSPPSRAAAFQAHQVRESRVACPARRAAEQRGAGDDESAKDF